MSDQLSAIYVMANRAAGRIDVKIVPCFDGGNVMVGQQLVPAASIEGFAQYARGANVEQDVRCTVAVFHAKQIAEARQLAELVAALRDATQALREDNARTSGAAMAANH